MHFLQETGITKPCLLVSYRVIYRSGFSFYTITSLFCFPQATAILNNGSQHVFGRNFSTVVNQLQWSIHFTHLSDIWVTKNSKICCVICSEKIRYSVCKSWKVFNMPILRFMMLSKSNKFGLDKRCNKLCNIHWSLFCHKTFEMHTFKEILNLIRMLESLISAPRIHKRKSWERKNVRGSILKLCHGIQYKKKGCKK